MVALSSRSSSSTAAIYGTMAWRQTLGAALRTSGGVGVGGGRTFLRCFLRSLGCREKDKRQPAIVHGCFSPPHLGLHAPGAPTAGEGSQIRRTNVITPIRSVSRAGLRGSSFGVECPLGGEEDAREDAVAEAVMEAP